MGKDAGARLLTAWDTCLHSLVDAWKAMNSGDGLDLGERRPSIRLSGEKEGPSPAEGVAKFLNWRLDHLEAQGLERVGDSQWWDDESRCFVGHHLLRARASIQRELADPLPSSHEEAVTAALSALRISREKCWEAYYDEYNFMAGAHNAIMEPLMKESERLGLARPWPELEPWEDGWVEFTERQSA
jgi:hypothetical protein